LRRLGSREEAEDVVHETYLSAFRSLTKGCRPVQPLAWLLTIADRRCASWYRARAARIDAEPLGAEEPAAAEPPPPAEELFELPHALARLPEGQRRAFLMRELQGLSYEEIGSKLSLSTTAVATTVFRARRTLAERLEHPDGQVGCAASSLRGGSSRRAAGYVTRRRTM
jgi:RNA polymerase sigma-70 factor, ECF subfamily